MGNSIINWIEQWLTDSRQRVVVDGKVSSLKSVLNGVHQGYVGPTRIHFILGIHRPFRGRHIEICRRH